MAASAQLLLFPSIAADDLVSEAALVEYLGALGAATVPAVSAAERDLLKGRGPANADVVRGLRRAIRAGDDPLGEAFARLRSPAQRRPVGATYTPLRIVDEMVAWAATHALPDRVVDPGTGSARFLLAAGQAFPKAELVGLELDPLAALMARANLTAAGMATRSRVLVGDYRTLELERISGKTLFIGNPPYVRHHLIAPEWKDWLVKQAGSRHYTASQLAGLHVHFFLATCGHAQPGDYGALLTAAEWLDVNYGKLVRDLFLNELGGDGIVVVEPTARPFPDAATTAAITTFEVGSRPSSIRLSRAPGVEDIGRGLQSGMLVRRERLVAERRWSGLLRMARPIPEGYVELGELCRVHRGAVTGANRVWINGSHSADLPPSVLYPTVTKARDLFNAGAALVDSTKLRRVIDLPEDLDQLPTDARQAVERFLQWARQMGADKGYVATHRRAWWAVGLRQPPPIMATYMARRPPAFVENRAAARYINIAHGIYPREPMDATQIASLASYLVIASKTAEGRTYAGGLMKFEPSEMERILVPRPDRLAAEATQ